MADAFELRAVRLTLCSACLDGDGEECHTPGCALIWSGVPSKSLREYIDDAPLGPGAIPEALRDELESLRTENTSLRERLDAANREANAHGAEVLRLRERVERAEAEASRQLGRRRLAQDDRNAYELANGRLTEQLIASESARLRAEAELAAIIESHVITSDDYLELQEQLSRAEAQRDAHAVKCDLCEGTDAIRGALLPHMVGASDDDRQKPFPCPRCVLGYISKYEKRLKAADEMFTYLCSLSWTYQCRRLAEAYDIAKREEEGD